MLTQHDINEAWDTIHANWDDPEFIMTNVTFINGFLLGSDKPHLAMVVLKLAEDKLSPSDPSVLNLKRRLGLIGDG